MVLKLSELMMEEKGLALFPTILLVIIVLAIGITTFELATMEARISINQQMAMEALYLSEAGIQMAIRQLEQNPDWREGYRNYSLGTGIISKVEIRHDANTIRIESQAEVQGVGRRVRVELAKIMVPFTNALQSKSLELRPGARLSIKGDAVINGNLEVISLAELEGHLLVDGAVRIEEATLRGSLSATGPILIQGDSIVEGELVSSDSIICFADVREDCEAFPLVPVPVPPTWPTLDTSWYQSKTHIPIEEGIIFVDEISGGIYFASGDLTLARGQLKDTYTGLLAVVAEGTVYIDCNLLPDNPELDALIIVGQDIIIAEGVTEIWAALLAKDRVFVWGNPAGNKFFGTIQAPIISLPPGLTSLVYYPLPAASLVKDPQTLFRIINWLEVMLL